MEAIKFYTLDEVKDKHIGEVGTPPRGIGTKNRCTAFTSIQDRKRT